jgi:hypothetical protein
MKRILSLLLCLLVVHCGSSSVGGGTGPVDIPSPVGSCRICCTLMGHTACETSLLTYEDCVEEGTKESVCTWRWTSP